MQGEDPPSTERPESDGEATPHDGGAGEEGVGAQGEGDTQVSSPTLHHTKLQRLHFSVCTYV